MSICGNFDCCLPGQHSESLTQGSTPFVLDYEKMRTIHAPLASGLTVAQFEVLNFDGTQVTKTGTDRPVIAMFPATTVVDADVMQFYAAGDFNKALVTVFNGFNELALSKVGIFLKAVS